MKVYYKNDLNKAYLVLEEACTIEDYQAIMLRENEIPGVLKTEIRSFDEYRQYLYDISGKQSLRQLYAREKLGYEEIKNLIESLMYTLQTVKKYMLDGKGILLQPEFVFGEKGVFYYCYYPNNQKDLAEAFHELTEFLVKEVDYRDERGVHLAYVMHKATMEEHYSVERIMEEFLEERVEVEEVSYDFCEEESPKEPFVVNEKKEAWHAVKKLFKNRNL